MPAPAVMCLVSCVCVCSNFGSTAYIHKIVSFFCICWQHEWFIRFVSVVLLPITLVWLTMCVLDVSFLLDYSYENPDCLYFFFGEQCFAHQSMLWRCLLPGIVVLLAYLFYHCCFCVWCFPSSSHLSYVFFLGIHDVHNMLWKWIKLVYQRNKVSFII